jgi:hypothetical protein
MAQKYVPLVELDLGGGGGGHERVYDGNRARDGIQRNFLAHE